MSAPTFDSERVYTDAADGYAELSERLWPWAADGLASRMVGLPHNATVLDAGCGPGGVTLRLARLLGVRAGVTGVDVCEDMLEHARRRARAWTLSNATFQRGDMGDLAGAELPDRFDGVTAGLSLFLAPDIPATAAGLWERVAPGGRMAVSVVSEQFFTPAFYQLLDLLREAGMEDPYIPWRRIDHPDTLRAPFTQAGVADVRIEPEIRHVALDTAEDWTAIMHGTGIRALLDALDDATRAAVQAASLDRLRAQRLRSLAFGVLYAVADKPR